MMYIWRIAGDDGMHIDMYLQIGLSWVGGMCAQISYLEDKAQYWLIGG